MAGMPGGGGAVGHVGIMVFVFIGRREINQRSCCPRRRSKLDIAVGSGCENSGGERWAMEASKLLMGASGEFDGKRKVHKARVENVGSFRVCAGPSEV